MIKRILNKLKNAINVTTTKEGTVKFFNNKKGFGFIIVKDSDQEIFVHSSNLNSPVKEKDQVTFEIEKSEKGLVAVNVSKI
ncbi:cold-shock protein [Bizionia arctica]|uniref:CSD domain-containing protein n=1 Tax=Bizionia arctica TaxID=1495645 RepID=A0A917LNJ6_9FLAO|nr:cold shock domain-containing protein [Bizionia arctica]GGG47817.1 hypothetical protein GCM10010976_19010 [Bizionia arctica]